MAGYDRISSSTVRSGVLSDWSSLFKVAAFTACAGLLVMLIALISLGTGRAEQQRAPASMHVVNACPTPSVPYGEPLAADVLSNLRIGRDVSNLAYCFRSSQSGSIRSVRVYVKTGEGYSGGDGGTVRIDLVADEVGHDHTPSGQTLGSAFAADLLRGSFNRVFKFERPVPVSQGSFYHLVFSNVAADPTTNFVSINNLLLYGTLASQLEDLAVFTRHDLHASWSKRSDHIPIFALQYTNGGLQGQGYIDALSESGRFPITGTRRVRERITLHGPDVIAQQVKVRVRNPGSSIADLKIRVEDDNSTAIAEREVQVGVDANYRWVGYVFPAPLTLRSGQTYNIVLSSKAGVETFPLQGGAQYGFDVPTLLYDARYEVNAGNHWESPRHDLQMQFYFCQ